MARLPMVRILLTAMFVGQLFANVRGSGWRPCPAGPSAGHPADGAEPPPNLDLGEPSAQPRKSAVFPRPVGGGLLQLVNSPVAR